MIRIPAGEVKLRDDRTKAVWTAEVDDFWLAAVPVTNAQYSSMPVLLDEALPGEVQPNKTLPGDPLAPAVNLSWLDAVKFCNILSRHAGLQECYVIDPQEVRVIWNRKADGYRLPTEAEWQYACKADTDGYRYGDLGEIAWYRDNAEGRAHPVGGKKPNPWGLFDMLGNVWEWCWDVYDERVYGEYRIFRGGSWAEEARGCGATCRRRSHPTFRIDDLGFRLARSVRR
ncbi:formylglycine-generating enzyme family protein [Paenibacillus sp. CN-4]|uniref:formylglycine-generating enzyme family protein n=1 Tax=Paenibacillus nanchangensis TaxID=3348343 RepID=UPI00397C7771